MGMSILCGAEIVREAVSVVGERIDTISTLTGLTWCTSWLWGTAQKSKRRRPIFTRAQA